MPALTTRISNHGGRTGPPERYARKGIATIDSQRSRTASCSATSRKRALASLDVQSVALRSLRGMVRAAKLPPYVRNSEAARFDQRGGQKAARPSATRLTFSVLVSPIQIVAGTGLCSSFVVVG